MLEHHPVVTFSITIFSSFLKVNHINIYMCYKVKEFCCNNLFLLTLTTFSAPLSLCLSAVPGLDSVSLQFAPQLDHLSPGGTQPHKPLSRTRSEPLPQSPRTLHAHLLQQQHNTQLLERLKQQTHLGKVRRSECSYCDVYS